MSNEDIAEMARAQYEERIAIRCGAAAAVNCWEELDKAGKAREIKCAAKSWAVVEKRMGWRPIETAPKDGKDILLAKEPRAPGELFWRYGVGCFTVNGILFDWPYGGRPTHWQPIPPPPSSAEEGR